MSLSLEHRNTQTDRDTKPIIHRSYQGDIDSRRARVAAFIGRQKERARQHAASTHGRQRQSRVYSRTILLPQPSYKIYRNCVWHQRRVGRVNDWLSSKWSERILYELYNCFAVFEPRSPGLVFMTHFLDLLKHNVLQQERRWCKYCFDNFSTKSFQ